MILVDTNVLLRLAQPAHPHCIVARGAIDRLTIQDDESFVIVPQNLYEFYVVCTRHIEQNGLGMAPQQALAEIGAARALFELLPETANVCAAWESLISRYAIVGKRAHDARLVAMMIEHRVPQLLTFNDGDFRRFAEIALVNPLDVLGISPGAT